MNTWFTSDLHIGHKLVAEIRGFSTTADHDNTLARNWDDVVSAEDIVWVLGDISAGGSAGQQTALRWIAERPGVKHLVSGNHDGCHPHRRDAHKWVNKYGGAFQSVAAAARRRIDGQEVLLSHFPFTGDHTEVQRYDQWRLHDLGTAVLHGHTHQEHKVTFSALGTAQIHVGVDSWEYTPVNLDQLAQLLKGLAKGYVVYVMVEDGTWYWKLMDGGREVAASDRCWKTRRGAVDDWNRRLLTQKYPSVEKGNT